MMLVKKGYRTNNFDGYYWQVVHVQEKLVLFDSVPFSLLTTTSELLAESNHRSVIDSSCRPFKGRGKTAQRKRIRRIVIVGDDRAELYTSDAMANETRVKEETQQLKSFWQTTMRRRKVEVSEWTHNSREKS
jgi:hypothetical protein